MTVGGYGKSSKPHDPQQYSLHSRANDTIAVLKQEGIDQAHLLGASIGAAMCMVLAKFYPEYFKSYIFATPYFTLFGEDTKDALKKGTEHYLIELEQRHNIVITNEEIKKTFLANDPQALIAANSSEWFDYQHYAQYIKAPSLIYAGSQEPSVLQLKALSKQLTKSSGYPCQLHIFPEVDHKEVYWDSGMVCPVIKEFLYSH